MAQNQTKLCDSNIIQLQEIFDSEKFDVSVRGDGKGFIARSKAIRHGKLQRRQESLVPIAAAQKEDSHRHDIFEDSDPRAFIAESEARHFQHLAKQEEKHLDQLHSDLVYSEACVKESTRKHERAIKWGPFWIITFGIVGFISGLLLAVSEMLEQHGPTVTIVGTIGAGVIYLISALIFGGLFVWLTREGIRDSIRYHKHRAARYTRDVKRIKEDISESEKQVRELKRQADHKRFEAMQYRLSIW